MSVMVDLLETKWGKELLSDYHVVKCIHMSPMSEVFALESADGRTRLILKAMKPGIISRQMLDTLKKTKIDGLVPIHDYHTTDAYTYVIKPYIEGVSLQETLDQGLSINAILDLMKQLLKIVSNCHSQPTPIIMRDIKPDNLMICQGKLMFFDMESSKLKVSTKGSRDTVLLGTPGYAAPEQYGFQNSDERTDIYAIGQVMNSLLGHVVLTKARATGPLRGPLGSVLQALLLRSAKRIAKRATSFDPELRFQSTHMFEKSLEEIYPRIYVSSMALSLILVAILFVGFQLQDVSADTHKTTLAQAQTESETEPQTESLVESVAETTTAPVSETATESSTEPVTASPSESPEVSTKAKQTTTLAPKATTKDKQTATQAPCQAKQTATKPQADPTAGLAQADAQGMVEVRFSGKVAYIGEVTKCNFLINMEGISDPSFQKQFGNPVTLNQGLGQYSDINRSKLVVGDRYKITGYLDTNGNFSRDYHEPSEFISAWTFNGKQSQAIDFMNLVKDHQISQEVSNPTESDFEKAMKANFKVAQYGGSKEDFQTLLTTFAVDGNGTGIMRITEDHLKDIKLVVMANSRNEPISDYVSSAINALGFDGGSGLFLGWYDNRFWIYINANSSEEFKALIDKDRILQAIRQK